MGLTVAVGLFAQNLVEAELDDEGLIEEPFLLVNEVLAECGMPPHEEPRRISHDDYFESQMWGYNGLHALRRLAAHLHMNGTLPEPVVYGAYAEDPIYVEFNQMHERALSGSTRTGLFSLFKKSPAKPSFQHLVMHSDAEGFYLPRDFEHVIVDWTEPQRPGLGMMIGSSQRLLHECRSLAAAIDLPDALDIEADEFLALLENPSTTGPAWTRFAVEAHSLTNLIAATHASIRLEAAIQFT